MVPISRDTFWRDAGFGAVLDKADAGDRRAQAVLARLNARAVLEKPDLAWLGDDADLLD